MDVKEKKMEESFKYHIPEDIPANERTAFHGAAAAAAKAGKKNFNFGGKTHPVTMKKDTANKIADQKEAVKYPHMMYDPKTGKEVTAKTPMDHAKFAKMGYTHEKPQMKKESIGKTAGDKSYFHLQRAKELAKKDGHDYDKLPQYDRTSNKHKDHYHDMAKKESVKKESTMTFREKLLSLYEGDRKAHYKGATEPEGMHDKMKSSKGAMDMVNTPKEVAADGKKAADDNATKSAEKKMNKAKKRSGGDNIDKGDTKIVPGGTPVKEPSMAKEEYGMFGKKVSRSLLDAVASVSQVTEKVNKVKGDRSMHDQHAKTGFGMGGEQTYAAANGMKQTHYSKYISKKSGHESYFDGKDLVHAKSSKTVVSNALHGKHTPDQLAAKMKAHGDKHKG